MAEYVLMFDESLYLEMTKVDYEQNIQQWMAKESVLTKARDMPRSKKKMEELWKKGAIKKGDTLSMRKTAGNGSHVFFNAMVGSKS